MLRGYYILFFLLLHICVYAEDFYVSSSSPIELELAPKSILSLPISIHNPQNKEEQFDISIDAPLQWDIISSLAPFKVAGQKQFTKIININIPASAQADLSHSVTISIEGPSHTYSLSFKIHIQKVDKFEAHLLPNTQHIWQGEAMTIPLEIHNLGNNKASYEIEVRSIQNWRVKYPKKTPEIAPQEIFQIPITILAPQSGPTGSDSITVQVLSATSSLILKHPLTLIPSKTQAPSLYRTLDATLHTKLQDIGEGGIPRTRIALSAEGEIEEETYLDFYAASTYFGPDHSGMAARDEDFHLDIESADNWLISTGQTDIHLSRLNNDLFGKGARIEGQFRHFNLQSFFAENKNSNEDNLVSYPYALEAVIPLNTNQLIGASISHITEDYIDNHADSFPSRTDSELYSAFFYSPFFSFLDCYGELATSRQNEESNIEHDHAYLLALDLSMKKGNAQGEIYSSSSHFPGRISDEKGHKAYADYPIANHTLLWTQYEKYHDNIDNNPSHPRVDTDRKELGSYINFSDYWPHLNISLEDYTQESRSVSENRYREQKTAQLTLSKRWRKWNLSSTNKIGYEDTHEFQNQLLLKEILSAHTYFAPFYVGLSAHWEQTQLGSRITESSKYEITSAIDLGRHHELLGLLSGLWRDISGDEQQYTRRYELAYIFHLSNMQCDIRYRDKIRRSSKGFTPQTRHSSELLSRWDFKASDSDHLTFFLEAENPDRNFRDIRFIFTWTKRFGIPTPIKKPLAQIKGQVRIQKPEGLIPLPKAQIHTDTHSVYSDKTGHFAFPLLSPGDIAIKLDPSSIPSSHTLQVPLPSSQQLQKGERKILDLILVPSTQITGKFINAKGQAIKQANIKIQLLQGSKVLHIISSDKDGAFKFEQLSPGKYTLQIENEQIPSPYQSEAPISKSIYLHSKQPQIHVPIVLNKKPKTLKTKQFGKQRI